MTKRSFFLSAALMALVVLFGGRFALLHSQAPTSAGATLVQQAATMLNAANGVQHSHTSAATIAINPPGNQYVYITGVDISDCAGASAVTAAAPTYITTTGFSGGANTNPQYQLGSGTTAGACQQPSVINYATPLRSFTQGGQVTFVLPTFATNQTVSLNVYYFFAQ